MLAYARNVDSTESNLSIVLLCAGLIIAAAALGLIPILLSRSRRHVQSDAVLGLGILWALLAAGVTAHACMQQMKWSDERSLRIESGYYDPQDQSDSPRLPWEIWSALAVGYGGLILWPLYGRRKDVTDDSHHG
ncbi:MAG TPA: hypothetical protein VH370_11780 [Humisphaera sp.]|jgi:hypothetical protein|nr:hypothetical protein [Humisphaera sp.]